MVHMVKAYIGMTYIVLAHIVLTYIVMTYIVMAYSHGLYSYGLTTEQKKGGASSSTGSKVVQAATLMHEHKHGRCLTSGARSETRAPRSSTANGSSSQVESLKFCRC